MRNKRRALIGFAVTTMAVWCQTPVISNVTNAASYQPTLGPIGAIVTIFGTGLANTTASAQGFPLPRQLGGTSVTVGGVAAPLLYVSPTQVNLQTPTGGSTGSGPIVVSTPAGASVPYEPGTATPNALYAGGIFTTTASGCGQGAVLNASRYGSVSVNSAANSASPGDYLSVYGTGIAEVYDPLIGLAVPNTPLFPNVGIQVEAVFDLADPNTGGTLAAWSGLAPGFAGLTQFNVQIPANTREGCAVPLQAAYDSYSVGITQPVTVAIRQGGGPCVDPPPAGYGQITWQKTVSATQSNSISESDSLTVSLQASPGKQAPPPYTGRPASRTVFGPSCPVPGYRSLGAGAVTAQGPNLNPAQIPSAPFQSGHVSGLSAYQSALPNGAIQAGKYMVAASGGVDVGPFQAAVQIGQDIQIQTALAGLMFSGCKPLTITWTGGDPNALVTGSLVQQGDGFQGVIFYSQARASAGSLTISAIPSNACMAGPTPLVISIEVDPDHSEITTFSATGLSLGGQTTWKYIHTFQAVRGPN